MQRQSPSKRIGCCIFASPGRKSPSGAGRLRTLHQPGPFPMWPRRARSRTGAAAGPSSVQPPPQPGEHLVLDTNIRLIDGRELEPAVTRLSREPRRQLHFRTRGEVIQVVRGPERQHARRVVRAAEGGESQTGTEEGKKIT